MISPALGEQLAEPVAELYRDAELRLLQRIVAMLAQGANDPGWEQLQLGRLQQVRAEVLAQLALVNPEAAALIQQQLGEAYSMGVASGLTDVGESIDALESTTFQRQAAVLALANDVANGLTSAAPGILRRAEDVYRGVVAQAAGAVLTGGERRVDAVQTAINQLMGRGITGLQTRRGVMDLPTYVTMAVRTATARAALDGHLRTMDDLGLDLCTIQPGPRACDICDKWAGLVLSRSGSAGLVTVRNEATGADMQIRIDATLAQARAGGWGHPNDRCNLRTIIPGVTSLAEVRERPPFDAEGYKAQQRQRGIERQIRAWKTREAIAITPAAAREAKARVSAWQGAQRDLMAEYPFLKRQSKREQITGTLSGNPSQAR